MRARSQSGAPASSPPAIDLRRKPRIMRLDTTQQMRTEMRLRMAPRMIQSMEILQLPIMALQERIEQELGENPVLEDLRESSATEADGEETAARRPTEPEPDAEPDEFDSLIGLDENWSELYDEGPRRSRASLSEESDRKQEAMQNMASRPRSFHDDLTDQLSFFDCEPIVRELAEYIIHNLDERGLFKLDLQDVVRDFNGRATLEQAEEALRLVQRLDPPGVGARDLRECLLLQLTPEIPCHDVLHILISQHFDDLEHNRLPAIEKKTGIPHRKDQGGARAPAAAQPPPGCGVRVRQFALCRSRPDRRAQRARGLRASGSSDENSPQLGDLALLSETCSGTSRPTRRPANTSRRRSSRPAG